MRQHRLDQPLAEPASAVVRQDEDVGELGERRAVGHHAGEADLPVVVGRGRSRASSRSQRSTTLARDALRPVGLLAAGSGGSTSRSRRSRSVEIDVSPRRHSTSALDARTRQRCARLRRRRRRRRCVSARAAPPRRPWRRRADDAVAHDGVRPDRARGRRAHAGPTSRLGPISQTSPISDGGSTLGARDATCVPSPEPGRTSVVDARRRGCRASPAGSAPACRCRASSPRARGRRGPLPTSAGNTSRSKDTGAPGGDAVEHVALQHVGAGVDQRRSPAPGLGLLDEVLDRAVGVGRARARRRTGPRPPISAIVARAPRSSWTRHSARDVEVGEDVAVQDGEALVEHRPRRTSPRRPCRAARAPRRSGSECPSRRPSPSTARTPSARKPHDITTSSKPCAASQSSM